jgi:hypothetical protein
MIFLDNISSRLTYLFLNLFKVKSEIEFLEINYEFFGPKKFRKYEIKIIKLIVFFLALRMLIYCV